MVDKLQEKKTILHELEVQSKTTLVCAAAFIVRNVWLIAYICCFAVQRIRQYVVL